MTSITVTRMLQKALGLQCVVASNPIGSALRVVFDSASFPSDTSWRIVLEDCWRWRRGAHILASSEMLGGKAGQLRAAVATLTGRRIVEVEADDLVGALALKFDDDSVLETAGCAQGPEWVMVAGDGTTARLSIPEGLVISIG